MEEAHLMKDEQRHFPRSGGSERAHRQALTTGQKGVPLSVDGVGDKLPQEAFMMRFLAFSHPQVLAQLCGQRDP